MTRVDDANHYRCELPPGSGGFQQDTFYRITAGDATTQQYKLEVQIAPTIIVDRIDYHFPPYTEQPDRTIKSQGDIKALEGTQVTIHATANMDIKEARIDLGCAGLQMLPMTTTGTKATGQFKLALDADNAGKPQYDQLPDPLHRHQRPQRPPAGPLSHRRRSRPAAGDRDRRAASGRSARCPRMANCGSTYAPPIDYALRHVALHAQRRSAGQARKPGPGSGDPVEPPQAGQGLVETVSKTTISSGPPN